MGLDEFDIIVVKSQDRLMRNTKEWYLFAERLVQADKQLYFYLENKFYTPDDALVTGIKAILAEEYSRELSRKINNAHKHRQQSGGTVLLTSNTWGYDKAGKDVVINEKEAEIVRLIYELCLKGNGSRTIARELQNRGIKSRSGGKFQETTIRRIIRNPLFKGTAVMNTRHIDFNGKKTRRVPPDEWIMHENAVPAIIDAETWEKANALMDSRCAKVQAPASAQPGRGVNHGKHNLSGKLICGMCGCAYWRRSRKNAKGERVIAWSCSEYVRRGRKSNLTERGKAKEKIQAEGGCDNIHIRESEFLGALSEAAGTVFTENPDEIINSAMEILNSVLAADFTEELEELQQRKNRISEKRHTLLDKVLDGVVSDDLYTHKDSSLKEEYEKVRSRIAFIEESGKAGKTAAERLEFMKTDLAEIARKESGARQLMEHIRKIVIYPAYADVQLDSGKSIRINIERNGYRAVLRSV